MIETLLRKLTAAIIRLRLGMLRLGMQILYADKKSSKNRNNAVVENVVEEYDF